MKITVYPTAPGCHRPPQPMLKAREFIRAGKAVAISSRDDPGRSPLQLAGAVRIGPWSGFVKAAPDLAVIDNLRFVDPDGCALFDGREGPPDDLVDPDPDGPGVVGVEAFRDLLGALRGAGTREVVLVSEVYGISPAWQAELDAWEAVIAWNAARTLPWRTWRSSRPERRLTESEPEGDSVLAARYGEAGHDWGGEISARLHGEESRLLMTVAAEFNDLEFGARNPQACGAGPGDPDVPPAFAVAMMDLMNRLFEGEPEERVRSLGTALSERFLLLYCCVRTYCDPDPERTMENRLGAPAWPAPPRRPDLHLVDSGD